jgi:hypothetical protein
MINAPFSTGQLRLFLNSVLRSPNRPEQHYFGGAGVGSGSNGSASASDVQHRQILGTVMNCHNFFFFGIGTHS